MDEIRNPRAVSFGCFRPTRRWAARKLRGVVAELGEASPVLQRHLTAPAVRRARRRSPPSARSPRWAHEAAAHLSCIGATREHRRDPRHHRERAASAAVARRRPAQRHGHRGRVPLRQRPGALIRETQPATTGTSRAAYPEYHHQGVTRSATCSTSPTRWRPAPIRRSRGSSSNQDACFHFVEQAHRRHGTDRAGRHVLPLTSRASRIPQLY